MARCGGMTKRTATTVSTTAVELTLPTAFPKPMCCTIQVQDNGIFYTTDGSTPSGTVGFDAPSGTIIELSGWGEIDRFLAIRSGGVDAVLETEFGSDHVP